jgi:glutamine cyclotransferase
MVRVQETNSKLHGYDRMDNVLNGIAYDPQEDVFYLTGKRWDFIFKIKIN